jgi:hypothetical protein
VLGVQVVVTVGPQHASQPKICQVVVHAVPWTLAEQSAAGQLVVLVEQFIDKATRRLASQDSAPIGQASQGLAVVSQHCKKGL